jgi:hypothetical protein
MIYCVWYPSGGFGHFINAVLTLHGDNFVRPKKSLKFSADGNSHDLDLVVPKYLHEYWPGGVEFRNDKNYCVLVDNGITNEDDNFRSSFPNATVIKVCYSDHSWPVVAKTMINKAMQSSIELELPANEWQTVEAWAQREKYFLFLRDHAFRHAWRPSDDYVIYIDNLYNDCNEFFKAINSIVQTEYCPDLWLNWKNANAEYFDSVRIAKRIISDVKMKIKTDLTHITDVWTQAVVYYYIWLTYEFEVPHNDYSNWFTNTTDIITMLDNYGVSV